MVKFYMAQVASFLDIAIECCAFIHDHALICYYDERGKIDRMKENYKHLMLDSGAYTADTMGEKIDIHDYAKYLLINGHKLETYVNLDVIGNAEKTLKNQNFLEKKGLEPLPVFHAGEDMKYLDDYVNSYEYVGLGGMAINFNKKSRFLESIFNRYPDHKFHGFGVGSANIMNKFPFYSADSTSWLIGGGKGILPFKNLSNCHYKKLTSNHLKAIKEMGFSMQLINEKYMTRNLFGLLNILSSLKTHKYHISHEVQINDVTEEFT